MAEKEQMEMTENEMEALDEATNGAAETANDDEQNEPNEYNINKETMNCNKETMKDSDEEANDEEKDGETDEQDAEQQTDLEAEETIDAQALQEENDTLKAQLDVLKDRLLRLQAEFDNYRKRTEKERLEAKKYEAEALASELLPVLDNFERALKTEVDESSKGFYDGVKMVYEQLLEALKTQGVEQMDVLNKPFDPNLHHAVMQDENDSVESNIITEEFQKGYMIKDKVLRPAMVKVNK